MYIMDENTKKSLDGRTPGGLENHLIPNPKKIYCIDIGFVNSISSKFSHDRGRLLENNHLHAFLLSNL